MTSLNRRATVTTNVGGILIGSNHPIVVQSMTNTPTADIESTVSQVAELAAAGSEMVRVTVNDGPAAKAVPEIIEKLNVRGVSVPIIGDFHFNGHHLLSKHPDCASALAKYRINPGNVGGTLHDENFSTIVEIAVANNKPIRIGVNWGSLDKQLLADLMDQNASRSPSLDSREVMLNAMVESALRSALLAEEVGLAHDQIVLSVKMSQVSDLVNVYRQLAGRCDYPLHLGLT
nr:flavodoxin-dependent (E)-4-hydroxy-3-methylbut-2-enyl-diphosphate synthase [Myxococcota bacterium]